MSVMTNRRTMAALAVAAFCAAGVRGEQEGKNLLVRELRRVAATKIVVGPLEKGGTVYTDRPASVEKFPDELAGWTLIAGGSELRWATREGLCFDVQRPAVVYVGYHERIKQTPDWLKQRFEKTPLRVGAHSPATRYPARPESRWQFELWKRSFPAGKVMIGPNKNQALPYIVLVEKGAKPENVRYCGPVPDAVTGLVKEGCRAYPDREYLLKDVPGDLAGATLVAMRQGYALEDGLYKGTHLRVPWVDTVGRELYPARAAVVHIAYDAGSRSLPEWLAGAGFKKTGLALKVGNMRIMKDRPMAVYSKAFKADEEIWLGPNMGSGFSGWPLQYLVMVQPAEKEVE